jgi:hypothetical protein
MTCEISFLESNVLIHSKKSTIPFGSYFGPKLNKNGWKSEEYVEPIVATKIKKLWRRVYSQEDVTNKQLSFKFA